MILHSLRSSNYIVGFALGANSHAPFGSTIMIDTSSGCACNTSLSRMQPMETRRMGGDEGDITMKTCPVTAQ